MYTDDINFLNDFNSKLYNLMSNNDIKSFDQTVCENFAMFVNNCCDDYNNVIKTHLNYIEDLVNLTYNVINHNTDIKVVNYVASRGIFDIMRNVNIVIGSIAMFNNEKQ